MVTDRGRSLSPTRIAAGLPLGCLLRSRNDGTAAVFFFNRGNPTRRPRHFAGPGVRPGFQSVATVDGGLLEHLLTDLRAPRQPVTTHSATPAVSTVNTRPAASVFFQALKALIKSKPVQGTFTPGSVRRSLSLVLTNRRH
jgi:hypothetical protein